MDKSGPGCCTEQRSGLDLPPYRVCPWDPHTHVRGAYTSTFCAHESFMCTYTPIQICIQAGWLGSAGGENPTKKNIIFKKDTKMIRMI